MREFSLAYLSASSLSPPEAMDVAAQLGYRHVGLRLWPSVAGGAFQDLLGNRQLMRETLARQRGGGVGVWDIEVVRIGADFDAQACLPLLEAGAELHARAVLVIAEDPDPLRLVASYARLCALASPLALTVDLEFLPWTVVRDAGSALRVIEDAGRPSNAGLLVDALHLARSTTTLADIAALPRDVLHYAQICDGPPGRDFTQQQLIHTARFERLLPGEGALDLKGLFAALPPDLPVSIEVPHQIRMPQLGVLEWARQALAASRAVMGENV